MKNHGTRCHPASSRTACLAKDPKDRPESALALRALLHGCTDHGMWSQADATAWWKSYRQL